MTDRIASPAALDAIMTTIRSAAEHTHALALELLAPVDAPADQIRERLIDLLDLAGADRAVAHGEIARLGAMLEEARTARDSLRADLAESRANLTAAIADRDNARHERDMAIANRDGFVGASDALRAERDAAISQGQLAAAEAATLRGRVREFEARPVLTVEWLAAVISSKRTGEEGPRIGTPATIYAQLTEGGAVTLPAQDRAEELGRTIQNRNVENGKHMRPWDEMTDAWRAEQAEVVRWALASLGAPAKTPSVAADVFAAVSVEELHEIFIAAWVKCSGDSTESDRVGLRHVLDRLRVKLVAPVDPEAVARAYHDEKKGPDVAVLPYWNALSENHRLASADAMRITLAAKGIPVTPEPGKAGSP